MRKNSTVRLRLISTEINELSKMSDTQLRSLGITREQITAYVLQDNAEE